MATTAAVLCAATATAFHVNPSLGQTSMAHQTSSALSMSQDDFAKTEIDSNDVVVFSKSYCPFCQKTKDLFDGMGVDYKVHELDQIGDAGPDLQMALFKLTGQKTVPNVFVKVSIFCFGGVSLVEMERYHICSHKIMLCCLKGQHIGGNDDTQEAAAAGKIKEMLGI